MRDVLLAVMSSLLAACTGMRPAVDRQAAAIAAAHGTERVESLGDGCYLVGTQLLSCSIDFLPAGKLACAREPFTNGQVSEADIDELYALRGPREAPEKYYDSNLDGFVALLNSRRCHERWYDSFAMAPVPFALRDLRTADSPRFVPLADLAVAIPSSFEVSRETASQMCRFALEAERFPVAICVETDGAVRVDSSVFGRGYPDVPPAWDTADDPFTFVISDFPTMIAGLRAAPSQTRRCALAEVVPRELRCLRGAPWAVAVH